jgi:hypothetical protein
MPMNGYNVGRDVTIDIFGSFGAVERFAKVTGFDSKQKTHSIMIVTMDGNVDHLELPNGWTGKVDVERGDPEMDDYFASLESAYYNGQNIRSANITETITEVDGSISQYRYTGVMFKLDEAGNKSGDKSIKMSASWSASRRQKIV